MGADGAGVGGGIGSAIGAIAVLAGAGGPSGKKYLRQLRNLVNAVELPPQDIRPLAAPQIQRLAEYFPELYDAQILQDPSIPLGSPEQRDQQLGAQRYFGRVAEEGLPLAERLRAEELQEGMARQASRNQQAVLRNLAERGRLSGGDEIASRIIANQQSADLAGTAGANLAQISAQNRMLGNQALSDISGRIRAQDVSEGQFGSSVQNRFNEFASSLMTQAAARNAEASQRAQVQNVQRVHQVGDTNVGAAYQTALSNLNRLNRLNQSQFTNKLSKLGYQSTALKAMAEQQNAEQAAKENAIMGIGEGVGSAVGAGAF